jgi:hypothetical protein
MFTRPTAVPKEAWDACFNEALGATGRIDRGPSVAGGYQSMSAAEKDCVMTMFLRACVDWQRATDMGSGDALRRGRWDFYESELEDAEDNLCGSGPGGGGSARAKALGRVLIQAATQDSGGLMCPAP